MVVQSEAASLCSVTVVSDWGGASDSRGSSTFGKLLPLASWHFSVTFLHLCMRHRVLQREEFGFSPRVTAGVVAAWWCLEKVDDKHFVSSFFDAFCSPMWNVRSQFGSPVRSGLA